MTLYSDRYSEVEDVDTEYWDQLRINYEKINELDADRNFELLLKGLKQNERIDLCSILGIVNCDTSNDGDFIDELKKKDTEKYILYLKEFLKRKKRAIEEMYSNRFYENKDHYNSSDFIKLIHMFYSSPSIVFEIFVLYKWMSKETGVFFNYDNNLQKSCLKKLATEVSYQKKLTDKLFKIGGLESGYKVFAHCKINDDKYIYLIYRLNRDIKRADFDRPKRIKLFDIILFSIDFNNEYVEIKSQTKTEIAGIKYYFRDYLKSELTPMIQEVYTGCKADKLIAVFNEGKAFNGKEPEDFLINKIVFSNSLLVKSPQVTMQLNKNDIWFSVVDAFKKKIIDINSLRDISLIKFTSNNHSRNVRSIALDNSNVIFKLDDSGIDDSIITQISKKFEMKFGFPLNQPVENNFSHGEAEKIDYLLRLSRQVELSDGSKDKLEELKVADIINEIQHVTYICKAKNCGFQSDEIDDFKNKQCSKCNSEEFRVVKDVELLPNVQKITGIITKCFEEYCKTPLQESKSKIKGNFFRFNRFTCNNKLYQVLVTGNILSKSVIDIIERQLIPTVIVYYGINKEQAKIFTPNTIEFIDFGLIYLNKDVNQFSEIIEPILKKLERKVDIHVATVASKAYSSLEIVSGKTEELKGIYDDKTFEDEVYPLLKEIIPNSEKWGKECIGKAVPEGMLALQYKTDTLERVEKKYIFTYDCKFTTQKEGYDLNSSEKRKGVHYVKRMNSLTEVRSYCTIRQISAHIFISNKFKSKQIAKMAEYFYKEVEHSAKVNPVFLKVEELVYLYSKYCKNKELIRKVPDIFYEKLVVLLTPEDYVITISGIDELFDEVLYAAKEYSLADTDRITSKLKDS